MKTALAAASPLLVFHVREEPPRETANPIAPRQKYEKTFSLAPLSDATKKIAPAIDRLIVSAPGLTYVSFDAAATTASVKVSSEQPEALDAFEIRTHSDSALEIRLTRPLERQYILTEVSLPAAYALRSLQVDGGGAVVLDDKVLVADNSDADVHIRLTGSGDVFANSHADMRVKSLTLELTGSGDIQFTAPSVTALESITTRIASSGDVRVFAGSVRAPQIKVSAAGSGDLQLAALAIEATQNLNVSVSGSGAVASMGEQLTADTVTLSVAGSGDVTLVAKDELVANSVDVSVAGSGQVQLASNHARCANSRISVSGSGDVDARDLVAQRAHVRVSGSGDALFRASEQVDAAVGGSGSATIVGQVPPLVSGRLSVRSEAQKPSRVETLAAKRRGPLQIPTKVDAFEQLTRFNGTFHVHCFSDFVAAIKMLWNHRSEEKVEIQIGSDVRVRKP